MPVALRSTTTSRAATSVRALPARVSKKAVAVVSSVVPAVVASPAFALVDERLNGDGVGLAFGVNEPILGWILAGMFTLVWTLYAVTAKGFGQQDEDDGLSL